MCYDSKPNQSHQRAGWQYFAVPGNKLYSGAIKAGSWPSCGKDYEYCVQSSETLIEIAATRLMLNRLAQA